MYFHEWARSLLGLSAILCSSLPELSSVVSINSHLYMYTVATCPDIQTIYSASVIEAESSSTPPPPSGERVVMGCMGREAWVRCFILINMSTLVSGVLHILRRGWLGFTQPGGWLGFTQPVNGVKYTIHIYWGWVQRGHEYSQEYLKFSQRQRTGRLHRKKRHQMDMGHLFRLYRLARRSSESVYCCPSTKTTCWVFY
jgi:hypothetical protein